jgi:hypothetical protein
MLAQTLAFLGSLFNLCIDTIYKVFMLTFVTFLVGIVLVIGFAAAAIYMSTS